LYLTSVQSKAFGCANPTDIEEEVWRRDFLRPQSESSNRLGGRMNSDSIRRIEILGQ
jgi:hypothetical protein